MIKVEIIESNLAFFDAYELSGQLSYPEFHEISQNMEDGEYVKFELYEEGTLFYRGNFKKERNNQTVTDDIFSVLKSYQKQKKLKRKQRKEIETKINQALQVEKKDIVKSTLKSEGGFRSQKHQKSVNTEFQLRLMICFVAVITVIVVGFVGYSLLEKENDTPSNQTAYLQLLEQKQYLSAVESFPEKREQIEMMILEEIIQSKGETEQLEQYLTIVKEQNEGVE
ncbi:hypothetical protein KUB85_001282 [Enterococcus faecalis]|uniref:hypothetical protein n=1 Tax=Enterococcus faecalis TaxID=1351 RepID=UPI001E28DAA3|nr:hypothetical protein [Enterococcus faecalis]EHR4850946.1 hypothetical protein [Enterococcus faecalis]EMC0698328.1 hypothetical protein [Enterococcus faecalis]MCD5130342.1 hypothetical protein [Enterococcus faecalis]MDV2557255.1 hypothetical protein [Enterococcus faecalis]MDY2531886.1 hypothetical protein [Enterococcus faecalis]